MTERIQAIAWSLSSARFPDALSLLIGYLRALNTNYRLVLFYTQALHDGDLASQSHCSMVVEILRDLHHLV